MMAFPSRPQDRRISIEGQSNAVGQGNVSDLSLSPLSADVSLSQYASAEFSRVFIFNPGASAYQKLRIGTNNMGNNSSQFGPEFGIAVRWMQETVGGNLYIDKLAAFNGNAIANYQNGAWIWTQLVPRMVSANAWLSSNSVRAANAGWVWVQGESDNTQTQAYYSAQLAAYISSRISAGYDIAIARKIIVQMSTGSSMYSAAVASAKNDYAALNPSAVDITTMPNYFNGDVLHSSARGQLQIGYDAFAKLFSKPQKTA